MQLQTVKLKENNYPKSRHMTRKGMKKTNTKWARRLLARKSKQPSLRCLLKLLALAGIAHADKAEVKGTSLRN